MADIKITNLPDIPSVESDDILLMIDVSDETGGPNGTDKKATVGQVKDLLGVVQTTGSSTTDIMSQKSVSDELDAIDDYIDANPTPFDTVADMVSTSGLSDLNEDTLIQWDGYYVKGDGGGNSGLLKFGVHTADGGSIFSIDANTYVEANLKGKSVSVRKFGASESIADNSVNINTCISYVENLSSFGIGKEITLPTGNFPVVNPVILSKGYITFKGYGGVLDASNFNVSDNKAVVESLTRKNGVNLRTSVEYQIIDGVSIETDNPITISGFALSGFTRGCVIKNCRTSSGFYNGCQASGCWSSGIKNNTFRDATNVGLLIGSDILIELDGIGGYTDSGVNPVLVQEGYNYSGSLISIQCNAMDISRNILRGNKHNLSIHFGNSVKVTSNTLESASGLGLKCTAVESGEFKANYVEANNGLFFGRDVSGIAQNFDCRANFLNGADLYFIGFAASSFLVNEYEGTYNVYHGDYRRVYGNDTDFPHPSFLSDQGRMISNYSYGRDGIVSRDDNNKVSHQGLFTSNFDNCKVESGLTLTEKNNDGSNYGYLTKGNSVDDVVSTKRAVVNNTPGVIASGSDAALYIVSGRDTTSGTVKFIDVLTFIPFSSVVVISEQGRSSPSVRTYSVSNNELMLSMASGDYYISVRGFDFTNSDNAVTE